MENVIVDNTIVDCVVTIVDGNMEVRNKENDELIAICTDTDQVLIFFVGTNWVLRGYMLENPIKPIKFYQRIIRFIENILWN